MTYGFIDDDLWHNAKARNFRPAEGWLWILCISWVRKHKSRGYISHEDALIVAALHKIPCAVKCLNVLVEKRGLDAAPQGYNIHGYAEVYERHSQAGKLAMEKRWHNDADNKPDNDGHNDAITTNTNTGTNTNLGSLKELTRRALARGVAAEGLEARLDGLQQEAEAKGARYWVAYVLKGYQGGASLFDLAVSRWQEQDHEARKQFDRDNPRVISLPLRRVGEA